MQVLLVEDDAALSEAVCGYLRAKAFVVDAVPATTQATSAAVHAAQYAAVLLDLHRLPTATGSACCRRLRSLKQRPTSSSCSPRATRSATASTAWMPARTTTSRQPYDPGDCSPACAPWAATCSPDAGAGPGRPADRPVARAGAPRRRFIALTQKEWALLRVVATRAPTLT